MKCLSLHEFSFFMFSIIYCNWWNGLLCWRLAQLCLWLLYNHSIQWNISYLGVWRHGRQYGRSYIQGRLSCLSWCILRGRWSRLVHFVGFSSVTHSSKSLNFSSFSSLMRRGVFFRRPLCMSNLVLNGAVCRTHAYIWQWCDKCPVRRYWLWYAFLINHQGFCRGQDHAVRTQVSR